jgi:hypothetical protein
LHEFFFFHIPFRELFLFPPPPPVYYFSNDPSPNHNAQQFILIIDSSTRSRLASWFMDESKAVHKMLQTF